MFFFTFCCRFHSTNEDNMNIIKNNREPREYGYANLLSVGLRICLLKVISTDMSKHMDHVANLRTRVEMQKLSPSVDGKIVLTSASDRVQV